LYRTHAQSRVFEESLRRNNLPYRVVGGLRFYDRAEVKDLLAYLRVVHNPEDDVSLLRIINKPARGIGKTTLERMVEAATRAGTSLHAALLAMRDDQSQPSAARKKLGAFIELMAGLRAQSDQRPATLARDALSLTGYIDYLRAEDTVEADTRIENIQEVLSSMDQYQQDAETPNLTEFLELVTLETDADRSVVEDSITLMTVHAAKGLEFPIVFVAGLEEETFPSHRGFGGEEDPDEMEEERRLAYVAFTRARERLFLSYASMRRVYNDVKIRRRSRFLDEIPSDEITLVGGKRSAPPQRNSVGHGQGFTGMPKQSSSYGGGYGGGYAANSGSSRPRPSSAADSGGRYIDRSEANDILEGGIAPGMRVQHNKFGIGRVTAVADGVPPRVTVDFPDGPRSIISTYLTPV
jgi:DNA helicase II / ATP-dependent DNA helicase PcrA